MFTPAEHQPIPVEHSEGQASSEAREVNMNKYGECYDPDYAEDQDEDDK